jgi:hypothetical protein
MDLIAASTKEEGGQHVHGWENIGLLGEEVAAENKLLAYSLLFSLLLSPLSIRDDFASDQ